MKKRLGFQKKKGLALSPSVRQFCVLFFPIVLHAFCVCSFLDTEVCFGLCDGDGDGDSDSDGKDNSNYQKGDD